MMNVAFRLPEQHICYKNIINVRIYTSVLPSYHSKSVSLSFYLGTQKEAFIKMYLVAQ